MNVVDVIGGVDPARAAATAEAIERLEASSRRIRQLRAELSRVIERLAVAGDIPWSGAAAEAWRDKLDARCSGIRRVHAELGDLDDRLARLIDRLAS